MNSTGVVYMDADGGTEPALDGAVPSETIVPTPSGATPALDMTTRMKALACGEQGGLLLLLGGMAILSFAAVVVSVEGV